MVWEVFTGPGCDQWNDNGRYDYTLAIKIFEVLGFTTGEILEAIKRLSVIVREVRYWSQMKSDREEQEAEFDKAAQEHLKVL